MFTKEQLEAIAEKLPQKVQHIEQYKEQLSMHFGKVFFDFYKQNHNRNVDHQYVEANIIFFKKFDSKDVKWLEKHGITNWSIHHMELQLSKTVKSEQELISFMTNVLNHLSDGYAIERKQPRAYVKEVYEVSDLVEFIQEQMDNEIKRESEHK